jgi:hypothetical protein
MLGKDYEERHQHMGVLGIRAPATAAGLAQLTVELRRAGVIDGEAVERVKSAVAADLLMSRPRTAHKEEFERCVHRRLDQLFDGGRRPADA